jgi:hypothetical protein
MKSEKEIVISTTGVASGPALALNYISLQNGWLTWQIPSFRLASVLSVETTMSLKCQIVIHSESLLQQSPG